MGTEAPSGLFPSGPPRPTYREPLPVRAGQVFAGLCVGLGWVLLFALLGTGLRSYLWWLMSAGGVAWLAALVLVRFGDRGTGVGVGLAAGAGWTVAGGLVALYWSLTGDFPLW